MPRILESSFHPERERNGLPAYHLDSWVGKAPRKRWFYSHAEMVETFEKVNA